MLEIKDLHVSIDDKEIIKGVSLLLKEGEIVALMGPNGSGKSTLANVLMGHPRYTITSGKIILDGKDITDMKPDERARLGLFLSFQYPVEISGVTVSNFLRTAYNSVKGQKIGVVEFHKLLKSKMQELKMVGEFSGRYLNEGFSGGEKKKAEILQMSVLEPKYIVLDETDSGLDVDALKIVSEGVNRIRTDKNAFLIITHYNRILHHIVPDRVIVLKDGLIAKEGDKLLASEIEENGFEIYGEEDREDDEKE